MKMSEKEETRELKATKCSEREKLDAPLRWKRFLNKFEAEEFYEANRLGYAPTPADMESWISESVKVDLKQWRHGTVPIHAEVVARITLSSFLCYVITVGEFPEVVPPTQRAFIAMIGSSVGMVLPTLLFSIGLVIFPVLLIVTVLAVVLATILLCCAAGVGLGLYIFIFGLIALMISGMRFEKATGTLTAYLVLLVALNSQPFAQLAANLGLGFVKSLWSETGTTNPKAFYTNFLIGIMWFLFILIVGRMLPPWRTARLGITRGLLPLSLNNVAASIDLNVEYLQRRVEKQTNTLDDQDYIEADSGPSRTESDNDRTDHQLILAKLLHDKSVLSCGNAAGLTAFEPRLLRFGPPECSWLVLKSLCTAVDRTVLASLSLDEARQHHELPIEVVERLIPIYTRAANDLRMCANALMQNTRVKIDEGVECKDIIAADSWAYFEPVFFDSLCEEVADATNAWAKMSGPPDRTKPYFNKEARTAMKLNCLPWLMRSSAYMVGLFKNCCAALSRETLRDVFLPPYYSADKASWCISFSLGFTLLVAMGVYWGHVLETLGNESWVLVAYAFSTTQTAEGTVKKGILRILGTASGGLSGWLAITACGEDGEYGLIAWLTAFTAVAARLGLPRGFQARMGFKADYGFGPVYFIMTQALVVVQVRMGLGDKTTVTVDRIVTNAVGIAMAMAFALLPPPLYGGNPKFARRVLEEEKAFVVNCLHLLLEKTEPNKEAATPANGVEVKNDLAERSTKISALLAEANDFYADSSRLHSFFLLKVDPNLKECLVSLQVIASWIFMSFGHAVHTLEDEKLRDGFLQDKDSRSRLEGMLCQLEFGFEDAKFERVPFQDEEGGMTSKSVIFINSLVLTIRKLQGVHNKLQTVKYGFCG